MLGPNPRTFEDIIDAYIVHLQATVVNHKALSILQKFALDAQKVVLVVKILTTTISEFSIQLQQGSTSQQIVEPERMEVKGKEEDDDDENNGLYRRNVVGIPYADDISSALGKKLSSAEGFNVVEVGNVYNVDITRSTQTSHVPYRPRAK
ncbi:unnamed protein product [Lactuca saligna]|uniref:Uncharacterized protein n=1 Tax=Lactuca saligna TaxID=75948 RepID=A0AA36EGH6_LACSI|nr:unnamed protein product [Lactuca saligna]